VPAIGPDTIEAMHTSGCKVLAIESGKTLILERQKIRKVAQQHKISVFGIRGDTV